MLRYLLLKWVNYKYKSKDKKQYNFILNLPIQTTQHIQLLCLETTKFSMITESNCTENNSSIYKSIIFLLNLHLIQTYPKQANWWVFSQLKILTVESFNLFLSNYLI